MIVAVPAPVTVVAPPAPRTYPGLVTRALAFGIDAAVLNAVAIITGAVVALTFSVISIPDDLETVLAAVGGALYLVWLVGYFAVFWSTTGQTPGSRALGIRVLAADGGRLRPRRAVLRFGGLTLAALPLCAGFLMLLVDDQRRALHDRLVHTVVIDDPVERPQGRARTSEADRSAPWPGGRSA